MPAPQTVGQAKLHDPNQDGIRSEQPEDRHSSCRSVDEFVAMLQAHGIRQLIDVRTAAGSRRNPQFMDDALTRTPAYHGISATHLPGLCSHCIFVRRSPPPGQSEVHTRSTIQPARVSMSSGVMLWPPGERRAVTVAPESP